MPRLWTGGSRSQFGSRLGNLKRTDYKENMHDNAFRGAHSVQICFQK